MGDEYHIFVGLDSIAEDLSSAKYYWFVNWHDAEAEHEPYWTVSASKQDLLEYAVKHTKSLDPKFTEVIRLTKADDIMMPPIVLRDIVLENMPNRRITLLGDAAHPMAPCKLHLEHLTILALIHYSPWRRRLPSNQRRAESR